jgi:splicing factor 3A subunit 1
LANEASNVKFNFLKPGDPYNAYYQHKIAEIKAAEAAPGEEAKDSSKLAIPPPPKTQEGGLAPTTDRQQQPVLPPTKPLEPPEEEHYNAHVPEGLTLLDLDVIKLTAQFVARNGKSFLTGLASREHSNPQFNFLKPNHSLFPFFTRLCDAYSRVLMPPKDLLSKLQNDALSWSAPLQRTLNRLEFERIQDKEAQEAADAEEAERMAMLSIDWQDFVVVATLDFDDKSTAGLPPPVTLTELRRLSRALALKEKEGEGDSEKEERNGKSAAAAEMDEEEKALAAHAEIAGNESEDVDMEVSDEEEVPIRVVKDYQRPMHKPSTSYDPTKYVVSPITGELVLISEMEEHMRVSLLDPKWKQQKDTMLAKIKETTKASDDEIGRNLSLLARTRPDVFGTSDKIAAAISSEIEKQTTKPLPPPPPAFVPPPPPINHAKPFQSVPVGMPSAPMPPKIAPPSAFPPVPVPIPAPPSVPPPPPPPTTTTTATATATAITTAPAAVSGANASGVEMEPLQDASEDVEQSPKRQRVSKPAKLVLTPEADFLSNHPGPVIVRVQCPDIEGNDSLNGQVLEVEVQSLQETVHDLKEHLVPLIGGAAINKQRLSREGVGILVDALSLAHYNVDSEVLLQLSLKGRGGKKR